MKCFNLGEAYILTDLIGLLLITMGFAKWPHMKINISYTILMSIIRFLILIMFIATGINLIYFPSDGSDISSQFINNLTQGVTLTFFCIALWNLSHHFTLERAQKSWKLSFALFVFSYIISFCILIFFIMPMFTAMLNASSNEEISNFMADSFLFNPLTLILVPIMLISIYIPYIHILVSISRTKHEIMELPVTNEDIELDSMNAPQSIT